MKSNYFRQVIFNFIAVTSLVSLLFLISSARANAFGSARVTSTTLNIRLLPKPTAPIRGTYSFHNIISLTGVCKRYNSSYTTVISSFNFHLGSGSVAYYTGLLSLSRTWCQTYHNKFNVLVYEIGWVNASYLDTLTL
jgi:hypothetical protein